MLPMKTPVLNESQKLNYKSKKQHGFLIYNLYSFQAVMVQPIAIFLAVMVASAVAADCESFSESEHCRIRSEL